MPWRHPSCRKVTFLRKEREKGGRLGFICCFGVVQNNFLDFIWFHFSISPWNFAWIWGLQVGKWWKMPQALRLSVSFASFFNSMHDNICDQVAPCYTNNVCFKLINYRFFDSSILAHLAIHFASQTFCCFGLVLVHVWSIEQPLGWTAASQHAAITVTMLQLHSPEEQSSLRAVLSGRNPATVGWDIQYPIKNGRFWDSPQQLLQDFFHQHYLLVNVIHTFSICFLLQHRRGTQNHTRKKGLCQRLLYPL